MVCCGATGGQGGDSLHTCFFASIWVSNRFKLLSLPRITIEIMIIISTRDFRANQTKFLNMANNGEDIVLKSRGNGSFKIVPVDKNDTITGKRDLMTEFRGALQQVKDHMEGKIELKLAESLLMNLEKEMTE
jgi:antitoxin (DNA-binding transcriptional repressor) of toxin-antitoxin stability system